MRHIGLTGGIGSGKSTVAAVWSSLGARLVDTDGIARSLTAPGGDAIAALRSAFGSDIIDADGALDRDRMRALAFADSTARRRLEAILHPMIGTRAMQQAVSAGGATVVFDVPLLTESSHWRARCERIVVVDCSEQTQIERVMRRSGWRAEQVRGVIAQQATRVARRAIADAVIDNDRLSLSELRAQAEALWALWTT
ncbi:MAG: dephospho-CoA kinase [Ideonella sp.]|nr:dephospho-CoA kinase [Ideonella sp.]MCC7457242.1 dephospho-CoA kinase [Nitrospira sp.]